MSQNYQDKDVTTVLPTATSPTLNSSEASETGNHCPLYTSPSPRD